MKHGYDIIKERSLRKSKRKLSKIKNRPVIEFVKPSEFVKKQELNPIESCFHDFDFNYKPYTAFKTNANAICTFKDALNLIDYFKPFWIRPLEKFSTRLYNKERQFSYLIRHLFAKYKVPSYMDTVWFDNRGWQFWWIDIAQGKNLKKCAGLPIKITAKIAHEIMNAPSEISTTDEAIRYGQVIGLGGTKRLAFTILTSFLKEFNKQEDFWESVILWFVRNPMMDHSQISPILDFLSHKKYTEHDFEMKGRSVDAIMRLMNEWHLESTLTKKQKYLEWESKGLDWETSEQYHFTELLSTNELKKEGKTLHHCVGSYGDSCSRGGTGIFSLNKDGEKLITIELNVRDKSITQTRGLNNRIPNSREIRLIQAWASRFILQMSKWLN